MSHFSIMFIWYNILGQWSTTHDLVPHTSPFSQLKFPVPIFLGLLLVVLA